MALTDNIVAYWKLDESSGNAADATGNGFTLVNTNSVVYDAGLINNGSDFSTTTQLLTIGNNCGIDGGNVTISCWLNFPSNSNSPRTFIGCGSVTSQVLYYMKFTGTLDTSSVEFHRYKIPTGSNDIKITGSPITNDVWNHLVLTYDGSTLAAYVNNVAVTGTTTTGSGSAGLTSETSIGRYVQLGSNAILGKIDEVGIWSRVLSAGEVSTLYNGGVGLQYPFVAPPASTTTPSFLFNII